MSRIQNLRSHSLRPAGGESVRCYRIHILNLVSERATSFDAQFDIQFAFQPQPMIPDNRFGATVIARDERFRVSKLGGHGLTFDGAIQVSEASFHICYTLAADRTSIGCLRILTIAFLVNAVPAPHKNNCLWRRKHVISTNGAVALRRFLDTSMSCLDRDWHTYATSLRIIN